MLTITLHLTACMLWKQPGICRVRDYKMPSHVEDCLDAVDYYSYMQPGWDIRDFYCTEDKQSDDQRAD